MKITDQGALLALLPFLSGCITQQVDGAAEGYSIKPKLVQGVNPTFQIENGIMP